MLTTLSSDQIVFPNVNKAFNEPNGLLCAGGNLEVDTLLKAYQQGIFPWFDELPILWWSPDPRMVLLSESLHLSRSMKKWLKQSTFHITWDVCFDRVVQKCADSRQEGTWITEDMQAAYNRLHQAGYAHSIEIWDDRELVGGLYGPALGHVFFGESMFSKKDNASKMALWALAHSKYRLIDCQFHTPHLEAMGAHLMTRSHYLACLEKELAYDDRI